MESVHRTDGIPLMGWIATPRRAGELLLEQRHRVGAVGGRGPASVAGQRRPVPRRSALCAAVS